MYPVTIVIYLEDIYMCDIIFFPHRKIKTSYIQHTCCSFIYIKRGCKALNYMKMCNHRYFGKALYGVVIRYVYTNIVHSTAHDSQTARHDVSTLEEQHHVVFLNAKLGLYRDVTFQYGALWNELFTVWNELVQTVI